jgi:uncharacterized ferritin-like protein (DUF455 family)
MDFFADVDRCLLLEQPLEKCEATTSLARAVRHSVANHGSEWIKPDNRTAPPDLEVRCGRPERPPLVSPSNVPRRRLGSPEGRAALIHAIAHIEFNAINLALDAAYRFRGLPADYYSDWISVAADEARHFMMLNNRLEQLDYAYGDFPAHNGLWEMAEKTGEDCLSRMALVPRVLEARGLDVTPGMITRLQSGGDHETSNILEVILEEEVRHVAIGTRWFHYCCNEQGKDPDAIFLELLQQHYGQVRQPLNVDARLNAGFTESELAAMTRSS